MINELTKILLNIFYFYDTLYESKTCLVIMTNTLFVTLKLGFSKGSLYFLIIF
jgi:hypothetical protein